MSVPFNQTVQKNPAVALWLQSSALAARTVRPGRSILPLGHFAAMRAFVHFLLVILSCIALSATEEPLQTVVITTKPTFEQRGPFLDLVISDTNRSFDFRWGIAPDVQFIPVSKTIYDIEVCEVHKTRMEHKEVRIAYGLIRPGPGEPSGDTERHLFPHRLEIAFGGCVTMPDSPKTKRVFVCAECKKGYDKWKSEHKKAR